MAETCIRCGQQTCIAAARDALLRPICPQCAPAPPGPPPRSSQRSERCACGAVVQGAVRRDDRQQPVCDRCAGIDWEHPSPTTPPDAAPPSATLPPASALSCERCGMQVAPGNGLQASDGTMRVLCHRCVALEMVALARSQRSETAPAPSPAAETPAATLGRLAALEGAVSTLRAGQRALQRDVEKLVALVFALRTDFPAIYGVAAANTPEEGEDAISLDSSADDVARYREHIARLAACLSSGGNGRGER